MEEAVSFIQYLQAAYLDNELQVSPATADFVHSDIAHCPQPPSSLHASLFISLDQPSELIQIDISLFPFDVPPKPPTLYIRQPNFLSRAQHEQLCSSLSSVNTADDLYLVIEEIKPAFDTLLGQIKLATQDQCSSDIQPKYTGQMIRAWFWFITISTPEKRNDIVQCAPNYGLTGFLLAGKPGLMCLEGPTDAIDAYVHLVLTAFKNEHS